MDNNILAIEHGLRQIEKCIGKKLVVDCNQGLDARLIAEDGAVAKLLARCTKISSSVNPLWRGNDNGKQNGLA